jgi:hypothetical protein
MSNPSEKPDLSYDELVARYGVDQCPACFSTDLHSASINGEAAVSCCDCAWAATFSYLREQADGR